MLVIWEIGADFNPIMYPCTKASFMEPLKTV